jgi:hypothetical protein
VELASISALALGGAAYLVSAWVGVSELMATPNQPPSPRRRLRLVLALSLVAGLTPPVLGVIAPEHQLELTAGFWPHALACFSFGSVLTGAFLAWLWILDRRDQRTPTTAALAAACAGLIGSFGLQLHCASHDGPHLALGHVGVFVAWVSVYAAIARLRAALG